ncbi:MAG: class I SAM-dependent methyltransferase [Rhodanobacteraceae bacterium]
MRCENILLGQRLAALSAGSVVFVEAAGLEPVDCQNRTRVRLQLSASGELRGDMRARPDALPFADQSMSIVVLRHVAESSRQPQILLREAARVLVRGGCLLITGMHPCSFWHVWMLQQARLSGIHYRACTPWRIQAWLRDDHIRLEQHARFGSAFPTVEQTTASRGPLAACYMLHARKPSSSVTPIKLGRSRVAPAPINASLVNTARREKAG